MVAPAVRMSLRILRYVVAGFLAMVTLYGLFFRGDWLGAIVFGLFAWLIWPKKALEHRSAAPPQVVAAGAGQQPQIRDAEHVAAAAMDQTRQTGRSTKPTRLSGHTRLVATAVAFGVLGSVLLAMIVGMVFFTGDEVEPTEPDPDAYVADVRPHLMFTGWTDLQLYDWGSGLCSDLDQSEGDVRALIPEMIQAWKAAGYTDDQLPMIQNDSVFILNGAIHHLCPEWIDAYDDQFPRSPGG